MKSKDKIMSIVGLNVWTIGDLTSWIIYLKQKHNNNLLYIEKKKNYNIRLRDEISRDKNYLTFNLNTCMLDYMKIISFLFVAIGH